MCVLGAPGGLAPFAGVVEPWPGVGRWAVLVSPVQPGAAPGGISPALAREVTPVSQWLYGDGSVSLDVPHPLWCHQEGGLVLGGPARQALRWPHTTCTHQDVTIIGDCASPVYTEVSQKSQSHRKRCCLGWQGSYTQGTHAGWGFAALAQEVTLVRGVKQSLHQASS